MEEQTGVALIGAGTLPLQDGDVIRQRVMQTIKNEEAAAFTAQFMIAISRVIQREKVPLEAIHHLVTEKGKGTLDKIACLMLTEWKAWAAWPATLKERKQTPHEQERKLAAERVSAAFGASIEKFGETICQQLETLAQNKEASDFILQLVNSVVRAMQAHSDLTPEVIYPFVTVWGFRKIFALIVSDWEVEYPKPPPSFEASVVYFEPTSEQLKLRFPFVSSLLDTPANNPRHADWCSDVSRTDRVLKFGILQMDRLADTKEVLAVMGSRGVRPALSEEGTSFLRSFPTVKEKHPIVMLGTVVNKTEDAWKLVPKQPEPGEGPTKEQEAIKDGTVEKSYFAVAVETCCSHRYHLIMETAPWSSRNCFLYVEEPMTESHSS